MTSPGPGYYPALWQDVADPSCPLLCAVWSVASGNGNIGIYRSWDGGANWDAIITGATPGLPTAQPAQRPAISGTGQRIWLAYKDTGGNVQGLMSADYGGKWA